MYSLGQQEALCTLGLIKHAMSPAAKAQLISALGGAAIGGASGGGIAHATRDEESDWKRTAGGVLAGAATGAGVGASGYAGLRHLMHRGALSQYIKKAPAHFEKGLNSLPSTESLLHHVDKAQRAATKANTALSRKLVWHPEVDAGGNKKLFDALNKREVMAPDFMWKNVPADLMVQAQKRNEVLETLRKAKAALDEPAVLRDKYVRALEGRVPQEVTTALSERAFPRFSADLLKL